jgi:hypothetical protein
MGIGAALIMPATLSLLAATFPRAERTKAITLWAGTAGFAIAAGPLIAGMLLESFSWPSTFLINVPVIALATAGTFVLVPPSKATHAPRIDYAGGLLSVVWIAALVFTLIEAPHGWDAKALTGTVVTVVGLVGFVLWELRHPHPLLDLRRFANRAFAGANIAVVLFLLAVFGAFYYLTQHLQFVLQYDALETGIRMLPLAAASSAACPRTHRERIPRVGRGVGRRSLPLASGCSWPSTGWAPKACPAVTPTTWPPTASPPSAPPPHRHFPAGPVDTPLPLQRMAVEENTLPGKRPVHAPALRRGRESDSWDEEGPAGLIRRHGTMCVPATPRTPITGRSRALTLSSGTGTRPRQTRPHGGQSTDTRRLPVARQGQG